MKPRVSTPMKTSNTMQMQINNSAQTQTNNSAQTQADNIVREKTSGTTQIQANNITQTQASNVAREKASNIARENANNVAEVKGLNVDELVIALDRGEVVLLRTDTVYGIAARPLSRGMQDIYRLKQRPLNQPLPCFVRAQDIDTYAQNISAYARNIMRNFWPGALTLVLAPREKARRQGKLPPYKSIAFRCPDDAFCLQVLEKLDYPLCCTSANVHGQPAPVNANHIDSRFLELTHGPLSTTTIHALPSTIVDCTCRSPKILRRGSITLPDAD